MIWQASTVAAVCQKDVTLSIRDVKRCSAGLVSFRLPISPMNGEMKGKRMQVMSAVGKGLWIGAAVAIVLAAHGAATASTMAGTSQFVPLGAAGAALLVIGFLFHAR